MRQAYVDANVIVRLITGDPPVMADQAAALFRSAEDGDLELIIDPIVVAETVWVLSSFHGFATGDISQAMLTLLTSNGVVGDPPPETLQALALYEKKNVDFVDALLAVRMMARGVNEVHSFDTHFDRLHGVMRRGP